MLITKNTPISAIEDSKIIYIDKDVSLDSLFIEQILQRFPDSDIVIQTYDSDRHSSIGSSVLYNNEELKILAKNIELSREKFKKDITFDDGYTVEQAISASKKINEWADMINNANINGKPLSPLEKYALAYSLVSDKLYKNGETTQSSRNVISVLTGDEIVCAGFASALSQLCTQVGVPCVYRGCMVKETDGTFSNHANCIVRIEDEKYNIHGFYNADPTWDCVSPNNKDLLEFGYNFNFRHFLITNDDYKKYYPNIYLDKFTYVNATHPSESSNVRIANIESLYPEVKINLYENPTIYDEMLHDIKFDEIKRQTTARLIESFPIEDNPNKTPMDYINSDDLFETIKGFIMETTLNSSPDEKIEVPPFLVRYYEYLNSNFSTSEMIDELKSRINNTPDKDILNSYIEVVQANQKQNHYTEYLNKFLIDRRLTKAVDKKTLKTLFKNILPLMVDYDQEMEDFVLEELVTKFTPLTLEQRNNQKAQD